MTDETKLKREVRSLIPPERSQPSPRPRRSRENAGVAPMLERLDNRQGRTWPTGTRSNYDSTWSTP